MGDKSRFAVVGIGGFGSRRVKAVEKAGGRVACLVDLDEERISKMASALGCDYSTNYRKTVKRDDVDCVIVATPNKFHAPITIAALEAGKHTICEKPLARTPKEARAMVDAAEKNKVFLKTGSNLRYFSNVKRAKELIVEKVIGDPLFIRGWIGHDGKKVLHAWNVKKDIAGGGTFLDNGAHILDLFRWFLGDFSECFGWVHTLLMPIDVEDNGVGLFRTKDGKMAFIQSSWTEWSGYMYMEVYGSDGCLYIDNRLGTSKTTYGDRKEIRQIFDYSTEPPQSYELELKDFIDCTKRGKQPMASGYDGMKVIEMIHGIYESSKTGRKVKLE